MALSIYQFHKRNETVLTASNDRERSGLRSSTGTVTKHKHKTLAGGNGDEPGERGASQTLPGEESRRRWAVTGDNTLHRVDAGGSIIRDI